MTEDGSGDPIEGATVTLYEDGGTVFVASEITAADGTYDFSEVNGGTFDLEFSATGYDTEWFNDAADATAGTIEITESTEGVFPTEIADAALTLSALPDGSTSGTVTDDVSLLPISGATVTLNTSGGAFVGSATTAAGTYSFAVVPAGEYDLEFSATGYGTEWYDNVASAGAGSVTVGGGEAVVADAALTADVEPEPEPDPGSVSGTITDDSDLLSGPVSGVTVEAYQGGAVVGTATSAADGTFTIAGLAAGTYTVLANTGPAANPDTHFSAWYTDAPLFLTDDATDVVVAEGADTGGVDIALHPLFVDVVAGSSDFGDIVWMQESGITLGCGNDAYCASDLVTRAQMAVFLVRALDLAPDATDYFTDDDGNIHEANINALRGAGVTLGCDTEGTLFCPGDTVSRAQMASFIVRSMGYALSATDYFIDDDGNTHETNINTLRENGVTLGCNAEGTLYCPDDGVRRDHMAAFLHRALG